MDVQRYFITSAMAEAKVNTQYLTTINTFCDYNDAKLLILPMQGKTIHEQELNKILQEYDIIEHGDYKLNDKLKIKDYKVKPQAIRPLTGLEQLVKGDRSAIIAGTKINVKAIPNSNNRMAKLLMSTGAVTHPNYAEQHRIGRIAKSDHEYGGIIVEVTGKKSYHIRYVQALKRGAFCDLDKVYDGANVYENRAEALVCGDIHSIETDFNAWEATKRLAEKTKPKNIVFHDLFDGSFGNHHDLGDILATNYHFKTTKLSLAYELNECANRIKEMVDVMEDDAKLYIVASNHNEVLNRYLREGRFINDPQNLELSVNLLHDMLDDKNPLEEGIRNFMKLPKNVIFLDRNDDARIAGYYLGFHGDKGANGARGSVNTFSKSLEKCITGHTHTPNKYRNAISVGTLCKLDQPYNKGGASSWLHTNALLFKNGTTQLINAIDGYYSAEDEEEQKKKKGKKKKEKQIKQL